MKSTRPKRRLGLAAVITLLFCLGVWFTDQAQKDVAGGNAAVPKVAAVPVPHVATMPMPPWSEVQPANHGTNPIPEGFVQTAVYEDVARLAFPTPASVAPGMRARVLLGEISGATGRHKFVRIEEVASIKENRLVERRVMPADHLVVYAQQGKTEAEVRAGLPQGYVIRKKLLSSGTGVPPVSPATSRRYLIGFESKDADSLEMATNALKASSVLTSTVPDGYVFSSSIPNDPLFNQQWGLHNTGQTVNGITGTPDADIDAPKAWDLTTGSSAVTVAVIDSGIDLTHEDLVDNIWTNPGESGGGKETNGIDDDGNGLIDDVHGWDFVNDNNVPQDDFGHGTHVAGIIGAKGNNGVGVAGVCWNVGLVSLKVLTVRGAGIWSDVVDAVNYAKEKNLGIGNLSLGAYGAAPLGVELAFEQTDGVLFICAAGNGSLAGGTRAGDDIDQLIFMPAGARLGNIISVAASGPNGLLANFSNYGQVGVDMVAPGREILSTIPSSSYGWKSGTSMASAYVAGVAANLNSRERRATFELRQMLQLSVVRKTRIVGSCSTEGGPSLHRSAIQGTMNLRWPQLSASALGGRMANILPSGQLRSWGAGTNPTLAQVEGGETNTSNILALHGNFVISNELEIYRFLDLEQADWPFDDYVAGGMLEMTTFPNSRFRKLSGVAQVVDLSSASYQSVTANGNLIQQYGELLLMLREDGSVWSAATNSSGWTGRGTPAQPPSSVAQAPAPIPSLANIVQVVSKATVSLALDADGQVYSWGNNNGGVYTEGVPSVGILGHGPLTPVPTPLPITGLPPIKKIFSDGASVLCMARNGEVWGWGNGYALLRPGFPASSPVLVPGWTGCVDFWHTDSYGIVGRHMDGRILRVELSVDGGAVRYYTAELPYLLKGRRMIEGAEIMIDENGDVVEFGQWVGYLAETGSEGRFHARVPLPDMAVEAVQRHDDTFPTSVCLLADGRTFSWGPNSGGLLGNGIPGNYAFPVEIKELAGAEPVAAPIWRLPAGSLAAVGRLDGWQIYRPGDVLWPFVSPGSVRQWTPEGFAVMTDGSVRRFNSKVVQHGGEGVEDTWQPLDGIVQIENGVGAGCFLNTQGQIWRGGDDVELISEGVPASFATPLQAAGYEHNGLASIAILCVDGKLWKAEGGSGSLVANGLVLVSNGPYSRLHHMESNFVLLDGPTQGVSIFDGTMITSLNVGGGSSVHFSSFATAPGGAQALYGLREDGTLWAWSSDFASGGLPSAQEYVADATQLWHHRFNTSGEQWYVKRVDGSVWGWGDNLFGNLGSGAFSGTPATTLNYSVSTEVLTTGLGLNDWVSRNFSRDELGSINISGDEADPDRDGLTNLVEYALGSDPKSPSDMQGEDAGLTCSFETVSSEALSADGSGAGAQGELHFTVKLKRRAKRPGIEYRVEFSDDMVNWSSSPSRLLKVLESEKTVIYRDIEPLAVTPRRWARLVIRKGN